MTCQPDIAEHSRYFFKTGKGQYGQGDRLPGILDPVLQRRAKQHQATAVAAYIREIIR